MYNWKSSNRLGSRRSPCGLVGISRRGSFSFSCLICGVSAGLSYCVVCSCLLLGSSWVSGFFMPLRLSSLWSCCLVFDGVVPCCTALSFTSSAVLISELTSLKWLASRDTVRPSVVLLAVIFDPSMSHTMCHTQCRILVHIVCSICSFFLA